MQGTKSCGEGEQPYADEEKDTVHHLVTTKGGVRELSSKEGYQRDDLNFFSWQDIQLYAHTCWNVTNVTVVSASTVYNTPFGIQGCLNL